MLIQTITTIAMGASMALAAQAPDFSVSLKSVKNSLELTASPPANHHVNIQAPMFVSAGTDKTKPAKATEQKVLFRLHNNGPAEYRVTLYLCDDKKTFCEKHEVSAKWESKAGTPGPAEPVSTSKTESGEPVSKPAAKKTHGFFVNDPEKALALAREKNLPILIDFFGIWCPPCNMLDEKVFPSSEFQNAAKNFVKLKVDADAEVSWDLKSRYKVGGYPTIVLASADGDEIGRIVGYRPKAEFAKELKRAWAERENTFSKLKDKADNGDASAAERVGHIYFERGDHEQARAYLAKSGRKSEKLYSAEIALLKDENETLSKINEANQAFPGTVDSIERHAKAAELLESRGDSAGHASHLKTAIETARKLIKAPQRLAGIELTAADLWAMIAQFEEALKNEAAAKKAWASAAAEYKKELSRFGVKGSDSERGYNLEYAYCLWKSGDSAKAEQIYQKLERRYPQEFTFYFGHARMKFELKQLEEAKRLALKAKHYSYGDNNLRVVQLLAKIYEAQGQKQEGLAVIRETLSKAVKPTDESIRTHRYVKQLKDLEDQLSKTL